MKKNYLFVLVILVSVQFTKAQNDTLLYENFDIDPTAGYALFPSGNDITWVDYDYDNQFDANGRPGNWYWSPNGFATIDITGCLLSSSWFISPQQCLNYLMTPPIQITDANAVLHWKSAPRQTPYYLDGYKIVVSTTDNIETSFTDTIFAAAEYVSGVPASGGNFSLYGFSPGFVHGLDSTYVEYDGDSARLIGVLRPFSVSLAAYSGQTIYITFLHDAFDDNLIAVDDILITGTLPVGISELSRNNEMIIYPNPSSDKIEISFYQSFTSTVTAKIYDTKGSLAREIKKELLMAGNQKIFLNISDLASGNYSLVLMTGNKKLLNSFVISR